MPQTSHKKHRFFKRLIIGTISVFIFLLFIMTVLFNFYKDEIARDVLLRVNKLQKGELTFEDISVNPFVHFPNVSLALNAVDYYEYPAEERLVDSIPIIKLENLFVAFDVIDLIQGNVTASKIFLKNGKVALVTYADSSLNLVNAFNLKKDTLQQPQDTLPEKSLDYELNLEKIVLENIDVTYDDLLVMNYSVYSIQSIDLHEEHQIC